MQLFSYLFALFSISAIAKLQNPQTIDLSGTYKGSLKKRGTGMYLFVEPLAGRKGSYHGLLVEMHWVGTFNHDLIVNNVQAFVITNPFKDDSNTTLDLTPLEANSDGLIVPAQQGPVLELSVRTRGSASNSQFDRIELSPISGNNDGYNDTWYLKERSEFPEKVSEFSWSSTQSGDFTSETDSENKIYVGKQSAFQSSGQIDLVSDLNANLNAKIVINEAQPNLHIVSRVTRDDNKSLHEQIGELYFIHTASAHFSIFKKSLKRDRSVYVFKKE